LIARCCRHPRLIFRLQLAFIHAQHHTFIDFDDSIIKDIWQTNVQIENIRTGLIANVKKVRKKAESSPETQAFGSL
jgi:hypothetical protein